MGGWESIHVANDSDMEVVVSIRGDVQLVIAPRSTVTIRKGVA